MAILYILIGLAAGFLSGLLGIGGGIFLVPGFTALFTYANFANGCTLRCAIGTSLATMTFTALFAIFAHAKKTKIDWPIVTRLVLGSCIGALLGVWLVNKLPIQFVKLGFSLMCLWVGFKLAKRRKVSEPLQAEPDASLSVYIIIGVLVGCISGLLGIGGGLVLVPVLMGKGMPFPKACMSSISCTFPTVLTGAIAAIFMGQGVNGLPPYAIGFVIWPVALLSGFGALIGAPLGVKCLHYFPEIYVKRIFATVLFIIAWQMFPIMW